MADREIRFKVKTDPAQIERLLAVLAPLAKTRACRTCDYGDSPECGHEKRAQRFCSAPVGDWDCAITPCLGACSNPPSDQVATDTTSCSSDQAGGA